MRWPWQKETATIRHDVTLPHLVRCPTCSGVAGIPVCDLKAFDIAHDGTVIERHIGRRVACQSCPTIYSIGPGGVFRHHPQSSPLTPEVKRAPVEDEQPPNGSAPPPQYNRPIPRKAPSA